MMHSQMSAAAVAAGLLALAAVLAAPKAPEWLKGFPRARVTGCVLTALAWAWAAAGLILHPVDFLAFLTPAMTVVLAAVCIPLTWTLLGNLLAVRGAGALMMLWPMPVMLAVREDVSAWRLLPVSVGYLSLTLGMVLVFHPWTGRVLCEGLARRPLVRRLAAALCGLLGLLTGVGAALLGKAVGA